jgi:hypothetical protein
MKVLCKNSIYFKKGLLKSISMNRIRNSFPGIFFLLVFFGCSKNNNPSGTPHNNDGVTDTSVTNATHLAQLSVPVPFSNANKSIAFYIYADAHAYSPGYVSGG